MLTQPAGFPKQVSRKNIDKMKNLLLFFCGHHFGGFVITTIKKKNIEKDIFIVKEK